MSTRKIFEVLKFSVGVATSGVLVYSINRDIQSQKKALQKQYPSEKIGVRFNHFGMAGYWEPYVVPRANEKTQSAERSEGICPPRVGK